MVNSVETRIGSSISTLKKSQEYLKQARKNIHEFYQCKSNNVYLNNALHNNRTALEGYYSALMALYGLSEDDIYAFLDIQYCRLQIENENWSNFNLKHLTNSERKEKTDLSSKEYFFIDFIGMPPKDVAIAKKARCDGNIGSHFNEQELPVSKVEEICNATAGLVDGQLLYLSDSNFNYKEINKETNRIYSQLAESFEDLQHRSFDQCEANFKNLRYVENNNYSRQEIEKKRKYLDKSLSDNLKLTEFRIKYVDVCLDLSEADIQKKYDSYKNIYEYIALKNRGSLAERKIYNRIAELKSELFVSNSNKNNESSFENAGTSIKIACIVLILFVLIMLIYSLTV